MASKLVLIFTGFWKGPALSVSFLHYSSWGFLNIFCHIHVALSSGSKRPLSWSICWSDWRLTIQSQIHDSADLEIDFVYPDLAESESPFASTDWPVRGPSPFLRGLHLRHQRQLRHGKLARTFYLWKKIIKMTENTIPAWSLCQSKLIYSEQRPFGIIFGTKTIRSKIHWNNSRAAIIKGTSGFSKDRSGLPRLLQL